MNQALWEAIRELLSPQAALLTHSDQFVQQAAVMVLITDEANPQLVFTLRAKHMTSHAGEVCFPGGRWELQDVTLLASALRETHEEIGLQASHLEVLGALPARTTRAGTKVTPFVAVIPANYDFVPNEQELDVVFTVPLLELLNDLQIRIDSYEYQNKKHHIPVYAYQDYEIWGFTAAVTAELLDLLRPWLVDNSGK